MAETGSSDRAGGETVELTQRGFYASNSYRLSNGDTWQHYDEEGNLEPFSRKQRC